MRHFIGNTSILLAVTLFASTASAQRLHPADPHAMPQQAATPPAGGVAAVDGKVVNAGHIGVPNLEVQLARNVPSPHVVMTTHTNERGMYSFDNIETGDGYSVLVYSNDRSTLLAVDRSFAVAAGDDHHARPDLNISKGTVQADTNASANLIPADTSIGQGANISNEQLRVLPLFNRTFLALALLQPGVHQVEQGSALQGAAFSISGSRTTSTDFRLNSIAGDVSTGVDNGASSNGQAIPFQVNEAVQDLRLTYADPDVRYGHTSGGVIDILTSQARETGTMRWHGTAFGYFAADALNAGTPLSVYSNSGFFKASAYANTPTGVGETVSYQTPNVAGSSGYSSYAPQSYNSLFNDLSLLGATTTDIAGQGAFNAGTVLNSQNSFSQPLAQAQFGGSAGGPLFSEKFLVFLSYEGTRINNATPLFERVATTLDKPPVLNDTASLNVAKGVLALMPAPNVGYGTTGNTGVLGFYRGTAPNYTHVQNLLVRPDVELGNAGTLSFRYNGQLINQLHDDTLPASTFYPGNGAFRKSQNQNAGLAYNFSHGSLNNVVNVGFTQFRLDEVAQDKGFSASNIGLSGPMSTFVLSGIDTRASAPGGSANAIQSGKPNYVGGWYDSFWNACASYPGALASHCPYTGNALSTSPSPIQPSLDGDFPLVRIGAPLNAPSAHRDSEAFASDALQFSLGKHNQIIVGGEYRYIQNYYYNGALTRGLVVANNIGEFTSDSETCISCGQAYQHPGFDYELRQPNPYIGDLRNSSYGAFLEDKFQVTDRITLSAGARWDYFGQPLDTANRLWNFSPAAQGLVRQGSTGVFDAFDYQCAGNPTTTSLDSLYLARRYSAEAWNCSTSSSFVLPQNKHDVGGRFGMAYTPGDRTTVIRGAVGLYYDQLPATYNEQLLLNRPSLANSTNPSSIYGQNFDSAACGNTQCSFGLGTLSMPATPSFLAYQSASGANILYQRDATHLNTPYTLQYSASIQRQLTPQVLFELAYVGSESHMLPAVYDGNFLNEFYCTQSIGVCNNNSFFPVFTDSNIGASNYHSAIARISTQQFHGLTLHGSVTWSKSMDDIAGSNFPQSTDSLWNQVFGRQLYGLGNPVAFALGANSLQAGSPPPGYTTGGLRGQELSYQANGNYPARRALLTSGNIPSFEAVQAAATTTGARQVNVSHYALPQNPLAWSSRAAGSGGDYGRSDFDVNTRAVFDFVYRFPKAQQAWLNGFVFSGIFSAQTGQPFTLFSGPAYGQITQRINLPNGFTVHKTGNPNGYLSGLTPAANLPSSVNTACPSLYAVGTLYNSNATSPYVCAGNSARNGFSGPGYVSQDLALEKVTPVFNEQGALTLRVEVYNAFNRANYYNPISAYSLDGVHVNPEFGLIRSAHDPLQMQFAARISF